VCRNSGPHRFSIPGPTDRPTDHPARGESPCRFRCPGPHVQTTLGVLILFVEWLQLQLFLLQWVCCRSLNRSFKEIYMRTGIELLI